MSNAEVARRAGLTERRYAHYVTGGREPNLSTLLRIANVLVTTPNDLLGVNGVSCDEQTLLVSRLTAAANQMSAQELLMFTIQAEAVVSSTTIQNETI